MSAGRNFADVLKDQEQRKATSLQAASYIACRVRLIFWLLNCQKRFKIWLLKLDSIEFIGQITCQVCFAGTDEVHQGRQHSSRGEGGRRPAAGSRRGTKGSTKAASTAAEGRAAAVPPQAAVEERAAAAVLPAAASDAGGASGAALLADAGPQSPG